MPNCFHLIQTINPDNINYQDTTFFCHFFDKPKEALANSLKRWGLLSSPLLRQTDNQYYQIILGFQRLKVIKALNMKKIPCLIIIKERDPGDKVLWELVLSEFLSHEKTNLFDQSVILNKLLLHFRRDWVINNILPLFGFSPSPHVLDQICPLMKLEQELALAVLEDKISHHMALRLLSLSSPSRLCLGRFFINYKYSKSKQFEILEHLLDLKAIHSLELAELLAKVEGEILNKVNLPQQADHMRKKIRSWRYPALDNLERYYNKAIKSLKLAPGINLKPPPFFEGNTFQLTMTFHRREMLLQKIIQLKKNIRNQRTIWEKIEKVLTFYPPKSPYKY